LSFWHTALAANLEAIDQWRDSFEAAEAMGYNAASLINLELPIGSHSVANLA